MPLKTRKPTSLAPWPIVLLTGGEKKGKTWSAAVASTSTLIDRTFWFALGEPDPDEYGQIPGVDLDIVEYDGTYRGLLRNLQMAAAEKPADGKQNLIVIDSMTRLWSLLTDMAQEDANRRRARKNKGAPSDDEADITPDLWNLAKSRWQNILDVLREHQGPSLVIARMERVTVMEGGQPVIDQRTRRPQMIDKIQAEKGLPFDVDVVVEFPEVGSGIVTGYKSVKYALGGEAARIPVDKFTVEGLWKSLGVVEAAGPRNYTVTDGAVSWAASDPETIERNKAAQQAILRRIGAAADQRRIPRQQIAQEWADAHDGQALSMADDLGELMALEKRLNETPVPAAAPEQQAAPAAAAAS